MINHGTSEGFLVPLFAILRASAVPAHFPEMMVTFWMLSERGFGHVFWQPTLSTTYHGCIIAGSALLCRTPLRCCPDHRKRAKLGGEVVRNKPMCLLIHLRSHRKSNKYKCQMKRRVTEPGEPKESNQTILLSCRISGFKWCML